MLMSRGASALTSSSNDRPGSTRTRPTSSIPSYKPSPGRKGLVLRRHGMAVKLQSMSLSRVELEQGSGLLQLEEDQMCGVYHPASSSARSLLPPHHLLSVAPCPMGK